MENNGSQDQHGKNRCALPRAATPGQLQEVRLGKNQKEDVCRHKLLVEDYNANLCWAHLFTVKMCQDDEGWQSQLSHGEEP